MEMNIKSILFKEMVGINNLISHIDDNHEISAKLDTLVDIVKSADASSRVIIMGVGKNSAIAKKCAETWASIGIPSFYTNIGHMLHGDLGMIQPKDIIIYLSRSGNTREMNEVAEYINNTFSNITFAISCNENAEIADFVNYHIYTQKIKEADAHNLAPSTSSTLILALMDSIGIIASDLRGFKREDFLKLHPAGALGKQLKEEKNTEPSL